MRGREGKGKPQPCLEIPTPVNILLWGPRENNERKDRCALLVLGTHTHTESTCGCEALQRLVPRGSAQEREKVIYPDEDIRKYQREGTTIEQKDRFVKQKSFFTRHFNPKDEKALNVDLTRKEVFEEFQKRYPDVAEIVTELSKVLNIETVGIKEKDILSKRKIELLDLT